MIRRALLGIALGSVAPAAVHADPAPPAHKAASKPNEPTAAERVLAKIDAAYRSPKHLSASFEQTIVDPTFGKTTVKTGTLQASKPDRFRFVYASTGRKQGSQFIYDGKTLWVVEPLNLKVYKHATQSTDLPAAFAFFGGAGTLASQFHVAITTAKPYAIAGATVLELTPKQPSAQYAVLYLVVDPATGQVTRTTVINSSGLSSTYAFSKLDLTSAIAPTTYLFDPASQPTYKVEVVK